MEALKKTIAAETASKQTVTEEISVAKQQIHQLAEEKQALEVQLKKTLSDEADVKERLSNLERDKEAIQRQHEDFKEAMQRQHEDAKEAMQRQHEDELKLVRTQLQQREGTSTQTEQQASKEVAQALEKVRSAEETKLAVEKVMEQLKSELAEKQREVTSLRLIEANANVMVSEAKQKIDLFNELEQDWQKKQLRLCEKIDELTIELEQAKNRTQSEEVNSLKRELAFTNSIIADQRRKEVKLQEEIEALKNFSADSVNLPLKTANREVKPRMYCDICETFDQHETEDCPKQEVQEEMVRTKSKKPPPPSREYCDYCESKLIFFSRFLIRRVS
ncbi:hypothetical protein TELCIR_16478 [Teladorsagia circumcincta]|uniref:CLIP1 zinc knuckle domain-containing protein n=1 Tax=Teladorsagia circumcincta TaxID=45464 RepID=A0A2G9TX03_TELCI|nr:hypothetical protein TELCIR_16478 [Teladorsagia circumcincta]